VSLPLLPIDAALPDLLERVRRHRAAIVVAPPGAGKTTRVPPALAVDGPVVVLQPRRLAARSLAARIAAERGWRAGDEVGWHVRLERRAGASTKVLVVTEGILTAYVQSDPLLSGFRTVVLDEFHERSIHADLALALSRQAWRARPDLRLVVMSATLDAEPVSAFLDGAPVVRVDARPYAVEIEHAPHATPVEAVERAWRESTGHVLVFVPGAAEIRRLTSELARRPALAGARTLPLHGSLSAEEQDAALAPVSERKIVVATNVAETSLTIEGVTSVVDTGLHRVPRFDARVGLDRLETERISRDAAEQRAGRAGRTAPGRAIRLWDPRDILRPHREPEIARVDLAAPVLEVLAWGGSPRTFEWFEPPPVERLDAALDLLRLLGAVDGERLTPLGATLRRLPVPPRLARVLVAAGGSPLAAACCAVLLERFVPRGPLPAGPSDLLARADRIAEAPPRVRDAAAEIERAARREGLPLPDPTTESVLRALLSGFPDRLARRRGERSPRLVLAGGTGAVLDRESVVLEGELLLAIDLEAGARGPSSEARVRIASRVERAWLPDPDRRVEHRFDASSGAVRAFEIATVADLTLDERAVPADPERAAPILVEELLARSTSSDDALRARLRFAGIELDERALAEAAVAGRTTLPDGGLLSRLPSHRRHDLDRAAPVDLPLPSGRRARLEYRADGSVVAAVKLQELFGLAETPRLGGGTRPVIFELLAPSGRPVQTTSDLRSFWERTYPEVRRELRARYPKHPWPEDPWTATPTHRTKRRGS
jgi:ATP-dependent RNA helicase HrpB